MRTLADDEEEKRVEERAGGGGQQARGGRRTGKLKKEGEIRLEQYHRERELTLIKCRLSISP